MRDIIGCIGPLIDKNPLNQGSNRVRLGLAADEGLSALACDGSLRPFLNPLLQEANGLANQLPRTIDTPRLHEEVKPIRIALGIHTEGTLNVEVILLTSLDVLVGFGDILELLLLHRTGTLLIDVEPLGHCADL